MSWKATALAILLAATWGTGALAEVEKRTPEQIAKAQEQARESAKGPSDTSVKFDAILGCWGGPQPQTKISEELALDLMTLGVERVAAGGFQTRVRMEFSLNRGGAKLKVAATGTYENGQVRGESLSFDGTKLKRTDSAGGGETEFEANALSLSPSDGGRIRVRFEGSGGFEVELEPWWKSMVGTFGGEIGGNKDVGSGVKLDFMTVDVTRAAGDTWEAAVFMKMTIPAGIGTTVHIHVRHPGGRVAGDAIRFAEVPWQRAVPSTGQKDEIKGNPLVLKMAPDGGLDGKFEGDDGMPFTLTRAKK